MLSVRVGGHHARHVLPDEHRGVQSGLERASLALIDRMHGNLCAQRAALFKNRSILLSAAVIDQQHIELFVPQFSRQLNQTLIRFIGGNQHHDAEIFLHHHCNSLVRDSSAPA